MFVARHDQVVVPDVASDVVARIRNLRLVSEKAPGLPEELLLLEVEDLLIVEDMRRKAALLDAFANLAQTRIRVLTTRLHCHDDLLILYRLLASWRYEHPGGLRSPH